MSSAHTSGQNAFSKGWYHLNHGAAAAVQPGGLKRKDAAWWGCSEHTFCFIVKSLSTEMLFQAEAVAHYTGDLPWEIILLHIPCSKLLSVSGFSAFSFSVSVPQLICFFQQAAYLSHTFAAKRPSKASHRLKTSDFCAMVCSKYLYFVESPDSLCSWDMHGKHVLKGT